MKTAEELEDITVYQNEDGRIVSFERKLPQYHKKSRGKILMAAGVLGVVGTGFILAAPELGVAAAIGGTIAALGSAGMTLLSRSSLKF